MDPSAKRPKILRRPLRVASSHDATAAAAAAAVTATATVEGSEAQEPDGLWEERSFVALDRYLDLENLQYLEDAWDSGSAVATGSSKRGEYATMRFLASNISTSTVAALRLGSLQLWSPTHETMAMAASTLRMNQRRHVRHCSSKSCRSCIHQFRGERDQ